MNQPEFLAITCNSLEAWEKSRVHGAIGFGFASHWLKNWRESFKPITKGSNCNHVITFDSHLKTALLLPYVNSGPNCFAVSKVSFKNTCLSLFCNQIRISMINVCCTDRYKLLETIFLNRKVVQ